LSRLGTKDFRYFLAMINRKTKYYIAQAISSQPHLLHVVRGLRFRAWLLLVRLRSSKSLDVKKIIWVNPEEIRHCALELEPKFNIGRVIGGNWDKSARKFEDLDVYQSFRRRFIDGVEWETTGFYNKILTEIEKDRLARNLNPQRHWGCKTKSELDERMKQIDRLYYQIKTHGYELGKDRQGLSYDPLRSEDEVTVNIGRDGEIFFNDGRHRLAIAKILKIPKIPVKVVARHTEWMKFRRELIATATKGKIYQQLTHPDLQDIPSHFDTLRFDLIRQNLSVKRGTLLDIGAQLGYFCSRFEKEGFDCYAVENDPINIYLMRKLAKMENRKFKITSRSIFEYRRGSKLSFDIVLALNIFHHFLKTKKSYEELIVLLKRIETKEMFFQAHKFDEPQMRGAYKNFQSDEFADFVLKHTNLTYKKLIGETEDKRKIYKLYGV